MTKSKLTSARDYFDEVVKPAHDQFFATASNFQNAYAMATSLYHLHEWLFYYNMAEIKAKYGVDITSKGKLWHDVVEKQVNNSGFIRDLNNVAKHVELSIGTPSTGMHHSANTYITGGSFATEAFSSGFDVGSVKMKEGNREVLLDKVAEQLFQFWEALVDEFYPKPAPVLTVTAPTTSTANS